MSDYFYQKNGVVTFSVRAAEAQLGRVFVVFLHDTALDPHVLACVPLVENRSVLYQCAIAVIWKGFLELKGRYHGYPLKMERNGQVRF